MRTAVLSALITVLVLAEVACERDELVGVDPRSAPGQSASTRESILSPEDLPAWIDSVFSGFTGSGVASYVQVEEGTPELVSRGLLRFSRIQDSAFVVDTISSALGFDSARVVLDVNDERTVLAGIGTTLQLRAIGEEWDEATASWEFAVDSPGVSVPWSGGPGGTLGAVLSEVTLDEITDSIVLPLGERSDSLVRLWNDTSQTNTGLALVVADSGRVVVFNSAAGTPRLQYQLIPETRPDTAVEFRSFSSAETFIFDRSALALPVGQLRLGGVDGARIFTQLTLSDSVDVRGSPQRFRLRGSTVNKAELRLRSLAPADPPFAAEAVFNTSTFELADDFLVYGAKTPVGDRISSGGVIIDPDSLTAGSTVAIDITELVQAWSDTPEDSTPGPIRLVFRANPEATTFGFWRFGSLEGPPNLRPVLRLVFTPPTEFELP